MLNPSKFITRLPLLALVALMLAALLVGCGDEDEPAPTEIVVVTGEATPTLNPANSTETMVAFQSTLDSMQATNIALEATNTALQTTPQTGGQQGATVGPTLATTLPTAIPSPDNTALPSFFPTIQVDQAIVVEQVFEGGRMFWFRENQTIWVIYGTNPADPENDALVIDPTQGNWLCFADTFLEGQPELDPAMEPEAGAGTLSTFPQARVQQPIRGFGKLWRENTELRDRLGWALTSEIEHNARREYVAGGTLDSNNVHIPDTGEWRLTSFFNATYIFDETQIMQPCPSGGAWRVRPG